MDGLAVMAPQGRIRVWRGATGGTGRTWAALAVTFAVLGAAIVGPGAASRTKTVTDRMVHVIVTGAPGAASAASQVVQRAGGHVLHALPIVGGFDAVIPASALSRVAAANGVHSVTPDVGVHLNGATPPDPTTWPGASPYDPKRYPGSLYNVVREINADDMWDHGYTGKGVGVALIDSGVAPVPDITANLVNGPDLSLDATGGPDDGIDAFGHGTHMAGIIAGREAGHRAPATITGRRRPAASSGSHPTPRSSA